MATLNPFDLLGDDDAVDPAVLLAIAEKKAAAAAPVQTAPVQDPVQGKKGPVQKTNLPKGNNKAQPPVTHGGAREPRSEGQRGDRGGRADRGGFRGDQGGRNGYNREPRGDQGGRGGYNREPRDNDNAVGNRNEFSGGYSKPAEDGGERAPSERRPYNGPRGGGGGGGFRGGRRGGFSNGDSEEGGERPRRVFDRRSGTGRGNPNEFKREGAGRANWGTPTDELAAPEIEEPIIDGEKTVDSEKLADESGDANKESPVKEQEEKEPEPEEKEMTLEEYEKCLEEKRKALLALKSEERKVDLDKELKSMQLLSNKKNNDEVFAKLGVDKDKKKEAAEKAKKSVSINEFLKPAEGENFRGGRGRGRGRGGRGGFNEGNNNNKAQAPSIKDDRQFPSLGGK